MSLIQGIAILIITLAIYGFTLKQGRGDLEARGLAFTTLVIANLGLILSNRFWSMNVLAGLRYKNSALLGIVVFNLVLLGSVVYLPFLRDLFRFGPLHFNDLATCFGAGMACVVWFETVKYFRRRSNVDCLGGRNRYC